MHRVNEEIGTIVSLQESQWKHLLTDIRVRERTQAAAPLPECTGLREVECIKKTFTGTEQIGEYMKVTLAVILQHDLKGDGESR